MVALHFLEWEYGFVKAGFTYKGKRCLSLVISQNGVRYVRSGAAVTHNLVLHQLSKDQSAAVEAFVSSDEFAIEYATPIL